MLTKNLMLEYNCGGLVLSSASAIANLKQSRGGGKALTNCVQQILSPYFTNLYLSRIRIHTSIP